MYTLKYYVSSDVWKQAFIAEWAGNTMQKLSDFALWPSSPDAQCRIRWNPTCENRGRKSVHFDIITSLHTLRRPTVLPVDDADHAVLAVVGAVDAQLVQQVQ